MSNTVRLTTFRTKVSVALLHGTFKHLSVTGPFSFVHFILHYILYSQKATWNCTQALRLYNFFHGTGPGILS